MVKMALKDQKETLETKDQQDQQVAPHIKFGYLPEIMALSKTF